MKEGLISNIEIWDELSKGGYGEWKLTMRIPEVPPDDKLCIPFTRGVHHSLIVLDGSKVEFAVLSSTDAKPKLFDWPGWDDVTPRNVPKQKSCTLCGAYVICFGRIISTWEKIPRRMNRDDVTEEDIHNVRLSLA